MKAIATGLLSSLFLGAVVIHSVTIRASYLAMDFSTPGAVALFFCLVAAVNPLLRLSSGRPLAAAGLFLIPGLGLGCLLLCPARGSFLLDFTFLLLAFASVCFGAHLLSVLCGRTFALSGQELITVYAMLICACSVASIGFTTTVLPAVTGVFYYASPGNQWSRMFHPYLPKWIAPRDPLVIRRFYEGTSTGAGVDWTAWLGPLCYWSLLLMVLSVVMISVLVILRKQWVERERLVYPMAHLPLAMAEERGAGTTGAFFRQRLMWLGFALPMIFTCLNGLHTYFPAVPRVPLVKSAVIFHGTMSLRFRFSFVMVGFAYLIRKETALSIWVFALLALCQRGVFKFLGVASTENLLYGTNRSAIQSHVGTGAIIVLVLHGLWVSRDHLRDVLRATFCRAADVDDSDEILSYRAAVLSAIGGLVVMIILLLASGIPFWAAAVFLASALILYLGMTRIVVEVGLSNAVSPISPACLVTSTVGGTAFSSAGLACFTQTFLWTGWLRAFVMASAAHSMKLLSEVRGKKRRAFWALLAAILAAIVGSSWLLIRNGYVYGGINFGYPFLTSTAREPWKYAATLIANSPGPNVTGWITTMMGAAVMGVLIFLRNRFLWWPLAPIAFPLAGIWLMERLWFSIFVSWLVKTVLLKYGGHRAYKYFRPLFLGLILGQFVAAGAWLVIDSFAGAVGNRVFWI